MQSVKSLAKAVSKEMAESLKGTEEVLTLALTKAQKDNNTVYLERVPPFAGESACVCLCVWERGGEVLTMPLTKAQKDNNTMYLERVPPFAAVWACVGLFVWEVEAVSVFVMLDVNSSTLDVNISVLFSAFDGPAGPCRMCCVMLCCDRHPCHHGCAAGQVCAPHHPGRDRGEPLLRTHP
jgi:hypothetical protein